MPVSRISSVSLSLSFLRYIANIRFAQENLCLTSKIVFPHIPQRDTKKWNKNTYGKEFTALRW